MWTDMTTEVTSCNTYATGTRWDVVNKHKDARRPIGSRDNFEIIFQGNIWEYLPDPSGSSNDDKQIGIQVSAAITNG